MFCFFFCTYDVRNLFWNSNCIRNVYLCMHVCMIMYVCARVYTCVYVYLYWIRWACVRQTVCEKSVLFFFFFFFFSFFSRIIRNRKRGKNFGGTNDHCKISYIDHWYIYRFFNLFLRVRRFFSFRLINWEITARHYVDSWS